MGKERQKGIPVVVGPFQLVGQALALGVIDENTRDTDDRSIGTARKPGVTFNLPTRAVGSYQPKLDTGELLTFEDRFGCGEA